jgi:hypothetical protein
MIRDVFGREAKIFGEKRNQRRIWSSRILVTVHVIKVRNATLAFPTSIHTAEHHKHCGEVSVPATRNDIAVCANK